MKIIVIVDMQNDFVTGSLGSPEARSIVPVMLDRLREYEREMPLVLFTKDTHGKDYLDTPEGKMLPVPHCIEGTPGCSIVKEISELVDHGNFRRYSNRTVIKSRILKNTFGSKDLASLLRVITAGNFSKNEDVEIILMGVCTDICVVSNALLIQTFCPDVKITVDAGCCAGTTPEMHKNAVNVMKKCGINVINEES